MKTINRLIGLLVLVFLFCGCANQEQKTTNNIKTFTSSHFSLEYPNDWVSGRSDNYSVELLPQNGTGDNSTIPLIGSVKVIAFPIPAGFPVDNEAIKQKFSQELSGYNQSKLSYGSCSGEGDAKTCSFIYTYEYLGKIIKQKQVVFFRSGQLCQTIYATFPENYEKYQRTADGITATLKCF